MSAKNPTCIELAGNVSVWPNCAVPDCDGKANMWLGVGRCYPHSLGVNPTRMAKMLKQHGTRPWPRNAEAFLAGRERQNAQGVKHDPFEFAEPA